MKDILANTEAKLTKLSEALAFNTGFIGFDTEVVGPQLRGREFVNISHSTVLGFSVAFENGDAYYVPIRHKGNNASFTWIARILTQLRNIADEEKVWAHNAKFDHQALHLMGFSFRLNCSMIAAWLVECRNFGLSLEALGEKGPAYDPSIAFKSGADVLAYTCADARGTLALANKYTPELDWEWFREECNFAKILASVKLQGFRLDFQKLRDLQQEAVEQEEFLLKKWNQQAPDISITSSKQLQELFEDGTWRSFKTTTGGQHCTDKESMKYQLEHAPQSGKNLAQIRLDYQEVAKIVTTYTDGLIEEARQWRDQKLHPDLHHFGTITGRLSSAYPNIQNQPAHGDYAARLRECFIPDEGMEFTSADYSQIELRYFANYTGGALLQAFLDGKDLHQVTADAVHVDRALGKTINFGFLLYGGGPKKMARLLNVDEEEAKEVIEGLQASFPEIEEWRQKVIRVASARGPLPWVKTLAGRKRWIPELNPAQFEKHDLEGYRQAARSIAKKYGLSSKTRVNSAMESRGRRLVVNYLVQGGSRDLLVIGMNQYALHAPDRFSIVTTVHDEVLTQHPIGEGNLGRALLKGELESAGRALKLRVPIVAEPKTGGHWGAVK